MKRGVSTKLCGLALLVSCAGLACGATSKDDPNQGAGASAGASSSMGGATGDATCPQQTPMHGAPCQGAQSCGYHAFIGCYPSPVSATCRSGRWDVPAAVPYTGPCPGEPLGEPPVCPAQQPTPGAFCTLVPTLDGPPIMQACEYEDPACQEPRVATCTGEWQLTPCVPVNAGGAGAGGEAAGGAPGAGAAAGAGGAE